ncbi:hypothetical protein CHLRE_02g103150v5 [Chlamydomonas reinhardtii]|uniref:Uncharacterized protein n=1 Tax=Chlamydomonas reinhardtii TaxID=3055 RepID=A0A2K3E2F6_CHLRE|nr:uncharacterized protein CHLRE_02g103150v5 [Chlamydomonas reinhardtii]PNW86962.1 hypothetical protein CHLRE_02g103150v5 [Chlamydomonas reinhardtii]
MAPPEEHPLHALLAWAHQQQHGLIAPMLEACKALELGLSGRLVGGGAAADAATDGAGRHLGLPAHQTAPRAVWCAVPFASINSCSVGGGGSSSGAASTSKAAVGILGSGLAAPGQGQQAELTPALRALSGTWFKDKRRSESMEAAMNMMHLNGIVRQAVKLVRGVRIDLTPEQFTFTVFSYIGWFKVKEVYPMSGEVRQFKRRDLRRGKAQGWVEKHGDHLHVQLKWDAPFGGQGTDHFRLMGEDELQIESVLNVAGQTASYLTIYNRKHDRQHRHHDGRSEDGHEDGGHHHGDQQRQHPRDVDSQPRQKR